MLIGKNKQNIMELLYICDNQLEYLMVIIIGDEVLVDMRIVVIMRILGLHLSVSSQHVQLDELLQPELFDLLIAKTLSNEKNVVKMEFGMYWVLQQIVVLLRQFDQYNVILQPKFIKCRVSKFVIFQKSYIIISN